MNFVDKMVADAGKIVAKIWQLNLNNYAEMKKRKMRNEKSQG